MSAFRPVDEEARERYPEGWESPVPYIRRVKQPQ